MKTKIKLTQTSLFVALVLDRSLSLTSNYWSPQATNTADGTANFWGVRSVP